MGSVLLCSYADGRSAGRLDQMGHWSTTTAFLAEAWGAVGGGLQLVGVRCRTHSPFVYYLPDFILSAGGGYAGIAGKARNRAGEVAARVCSLIRAGFVGVGWGARLGSNSNSSWCVAWV